MKFDFFKLHSANIPVAGKERSVIYKLNKAKLLFIPNSLYELIMELEKYPIDQIGQKYKGEDRSIFDSYIAYLLKEDVGFLTNTPELFPPILLEYAIPNHINNAIVEVGLRGEHLPAVFEQLEELYCKHLEIRLSMEERSLSAIKELLMPLLTSSFRSVSLIVDYNNGGVQVGDLIDLYDFLEKIDFIMVHNFKKEEHVSLENDRYIFFHEQKDADLLTMTFPRDKYIVNIEFFVEALHYNPYYNKKVCIDSNGEIKNCLLHKKSFGNIKEHSIQSLIETEGFQELWYASPDKIIELKNSELRYCTLVSNQLKKVTDTDYSIIE